MTLSGIKRFWGVSRGSHCRVCHVILFFLRCLAFQCTIAQKEWGWMERCLNLTDVNIKLLMHAFEEMDQNIATPLPLPYNHLCKCTMLVFILTYPIVAVAPPDGLVLNVAVPMVIA